MSADKGLVRKSETAVGKLQKQFNRNISSLNKGAELNANRVEANEESFVEKEQSATEEDIVRIHEPKLSSEPTLLSPKEEAVGGQSKASENLDLLKTNKVVNWLEKHMEMLNQKVDGLLNVHLQKLHYRLDQMNNKIGESELKLIFKLDSQAKECQQYISDLHLELQKLVQKKNSENQQHFLEL